MLLSLSERLALLNILPLAEGSAMYLRSVRRLRKQLSFSEAEIRDWGIVSPAPNEYRWNELAQAVEIDMSGTVSAYVRESLKAADTAGKLHECLIDVFDQFFPPDEGIP